MKQFNTLDDFDFNDRTILLRVDINCPLNKETLDLEDDNRIRQIVPTVRELIDKGGQGRHIGPPRPPRRLGFH